MSAVVRSPLAHARCVALPRGTERPRVRFNALAKGKRRNGVLALPPCLKPGASSIEQLAGRGLTAGFSWRLERLPGGGTSWREGEACGARSECIAGRLLQPVPLAPALCGRAVGPVSAAVHDLGLPPPAHPLLRALRGHCGACPARSTFEGGQCINQSPARLRAADGRRARGCAVLCWGQVRSDWQAAAQALANSSCKPGEPSASAAAPRSCCQREHRPCRAPARGSGARGRMPGRPMLLLGLLALLVSPLAAAGLSDGGAAGSSARREACAAAPSLTRLWRPWRACRAAQGARPKCWDTCWGETPRGPQRAAGGPIGLMRHDDAC